MGVGSLPMGQNASLTLAPFAQHSDRGRRSQAHDSIPGSNALLVMINLGMLYVRRAGSQIRIRRPLRDTLWRSSWGEEEEPTSELSTLAMGLELCWAAIWDVGHQSTS